jgi:hypothetical protein
MTALARHDLAALDDFAAVAASMTNDLTVVRSRVIRHLS